MFILANRPPSFCEGVVWGGRLYGIVAHHTSKYCILMNLIYNKSELKGLRQKLRNNAPKAEQILWSRLKGKQLNGLKFRRQNSIGRFVLDFYCPALKLAIEVDGPSHFKRDARLYDLEREAFIRQFNIEFLRFTNQDIYENLEGVLEMIWNWVEENGNRLNHRDLP